MAKNQLLKFGCFLDQHGSLVVASDPVCHDLFADNLANTVPSTSTSAVIDQDEETYQEDRTIDTDDTDWEESNDEKHVESGVDETVFFQRIPPRVNPPQQRESLLTLALQSAQNHGPMSQFGQSRFGNVAPESTSTNVQHASSFFSPTKVSPGESDEAPIRIRQKKPTSSRAPTQSLNDIACSPRQPIPLTRNCASEPVVFSPTTTRLNMIATELTEPLCLNLLWERKEKTATANAVLKRRLHTYKDVTTLDQYPYQSHAIKNNSDVVACSCEEDITWRAFAGYHTMGW